MLHYSKNHHSFGNRIIHFSIDDVIVVFKQLTSTMPQSIFELEMFSFFLNLHQRYGCVISCYCFFKTEDFTLSQCTRNYKQEFEKNAIWLRFGFHGYSGNEDYTTQQTRTSVNQYEEVIINLREIVGERALDVIPRIHTFRTSQNFVKLLANNNLLSLKGLLTADDERVSYSLNCEEYKELNKNGHIEKDGIYYLRTSQRFDSLAPYLFVKLLGHRGGANYSFLTRVPIILPIYH